MAFRYTTLSESSVSPIKSGQAFEAHILFNSEPSVLRSVQPKIYTDQNVEVRSISKQAAVSSTNALNRSPTSQQGKLHTVLQKMTRKRSRQSEQELKTRGDKEVQNGRRGDTGMALRCVSSYSFLCSGGQPHLMKRQTSLSLDNVLLDKAANEKASTNNWTGTLMA